MSQPIPDPSSSTGGVVSEPFIDYTCPECGNRTRDCEHLEPSVSEQRDRQLAMTDPVDRGERRKRPYQKLARVKAVRQRQLDENHRRQKRLQRKIERVLFHGERS